MTPKGFVQKGANHLESIDAKARICRCLVNGKNRYSLFKRVVDHRGHAHWDFTGTVTDSAQDAASAYEYGAQPQRRKA